MRSFAVFCAEGIDGHETQPYSTANGNCQLSGRSVVMQRGDDECESQCVVIRHVSSGVFDTLPLVQVFD